MQRNRAQATERRSSHLASVFQQQQTTQDRTRSPFMLLRLLGSEPMRFRALQSKPCTRHAYRALVLDHTGVLLAPMFPACATALSQWRAAVGPRCQQGSDQQRLLAKPAAIRCLQGGDAERTSRRAFLLSAGAASLLLHGSAAALGLRSVSSKVRRVEVQRSCERDVAFSQDCNCLWPLQQAAVPAPLQAPAVITFRNELDRNIKIYWVGGMLYLVPTRWFQGLAVPWSCSAACSVCDRRLQRGLLMPCRQLRYLPALHADQLYRRRRALCACPACWLVHCRHV